MSDTSMIVGIDLGTTNSLVAVVDAHGPRVLGEEHTQVMPSVVRVELDGSFVVGQDAADRMVELPERTVSSVKRLMGRSLRDAQRDVAYLGYAVVEGEHDTARVQIETDAGTKVYSPQELSAVILRELRQRAETALGKPVEKAVVTVPAYFDDAQRQATRDAGRLAGLEVVRIVNEPTAAALAYGIGTRGETKAQTIAVYDLGGGTFDISVLRLVPGETDGDTDFFQVLSTAGDTHLGGDDVDHMLVKLFTAEIAAQLGLDEAQPMSSFDASTRRALVGFARAVKHKLSEDETAQIAIDLGNGNQYARTVTRAEFELLINDWAQRSLDACKRALRDAKKANGNEAVEIDAVVMVGGSTRISMVRERVGAFFGVEPYTALDPDRVVALGAAMQASIIAGSRAGGGSGHMGSSLLVDVIPLSLGIETAGGAMAKLIMRNSSVPARAIERFSTSVDGQVNVKIHVVQGEREMVEDCRSLGVFDLRGIPPMPAGVPKLVVEFLIDANGVLSVGAVEERSGKRAQIQIVPNHGLSRDEVDRIERESLTHAKDDMNRHRVVDLITNSKLDIKWISERFERYGHLLEPSEHAAIETALQTMSQFVANAEQDWKSVDPNAMYAAKTTLDESSVRLQEIGITQSLMDDQKREPRPETET